MWHWHDLHDSVCRVEEVELEMRRKEIVDYVWYAAYTVGKGELNASFIVSYILYVIVSFP